MRPSRQPPSRTLESESEPRSPPTRRPGGLGPSRTRSPPIEFKFLKFEISRQFEYYRTTSVVNYGVLHVMSKSEQDLGNVPSVPASEPAEVSVRSVRSTFGPEASTHRSNADDPVCLVSLRPRVRALPVADVS